MLVHTSAGFHPQSHPLPEKHLSESGPLSEEVWAQFSPGPLHPLQGMSHACLLPWGATSLPTCCPAPSHEHYQLTPGPGEGLAHSRGSTKLSKFCWTMQDIWLFLQHDHPLSPWGQGTFLAHSRWETTSKQLNSDKVCFDIQKAELPPWSFKKWELPIPPPLPRPSTEFQIPQSDLDLCLPNKTLHLPCGHLPLAKSPENSPGKKKVLKNGRLKWGKRNIYRQEPSNWYCPANTWTPKLPFWAGRVVFSQSNVFQLLFRGLLENTDARPPWPCPDSPITRHRVRVRLVYLDASSAAPNLPAQRPARPRVLKSEPRGLRAGTTLPSGPRALRRKDVCALRYSVPSLELLAASPGPSCSCSTAFPNVATGGKITFQSALQGVHFHLDPLEVHLLPRSRETPLAWRLHACSLHLCCKTSYRREARQSLLCSPPPSKERGKCLSRKVRAYLHYLQKMQRVVHAFMNAWMQFTPGDCIFKFEVFHSSVAFPV